MDKSRECIDYMGATADNGDCLGGDAASAETDECETQDCPGMYHC